MQLTLSAIRQFIAGKSMNKVIAYFVMNTWLHGFDSCRRKKSQYTEWHIGIDKMEMVYL